MSYQTIAPTTSTFGAGTPNTLLSGSIVNADFMAANYYAFGTACTSLVTLTGPNNICIGATSQIYSGRTGTWSSSDNLIATVDASGNVTGVAAGTVSITFTDGSAAPCTGIQYTRTVNITNCSNIPGVWAITLSLGIKVMMD